MEQISIVLQNKTQPDLAEAALLICGFLPTPRIDGRQFRNRLYTSKPPLEEIIISYDGTSPPYQKIGGLLVSFRRPREEDGMSLKRGVISLDDDNWFYNVMSLNHRWQGQKKGLVQRSLSAGLPALTELFSLVWCLTLYWRFMEVYLKCVLFKKI